jgi:glucosylceramidase
MAGADNVPVTVTITKQTPIETLALDGSVSGVNEATVGTRLNLVSADGSQIILQDVQGTHYRIARSATDYAQPAPPSTASTILPAPTNTDAPQQVATIRTILTTKNTDARLAEQSITSIGMTADDSIATVSIDPASQFQTIEGFGGAFTETSAVIWQKMGLVNQQAIINAYFNSSTGHGYTLCRTHINSCDFSTSNYAYDEVLGDTDLGHFSIERDEKALLPMIKAAMAASKTPFKLFATPWSPPAWMKTNGEMNHGGKLKPEYRQAWANYFVRYIQEYAKQGVNIWGLTMQNEPEANTGWDNCLYSPTEERNFIRDYLGPTLEGANLQDVKLMAWDHNRDHMIDSVSVMYADPLASRYIWGTAYHWYSDGPTPIQSMKIHRDKWPEKNLLLTEACQDQGPHVGEWDPGERYGSSIISNLNNWSVGWVDWNLLLDTSGGPNHAGNFCSAPILADTQNDKLLFQSSYYYMGHFARFIQPGAKRILCSSSQHDLETTACLNTNGTVAVVVMNRTNNPIKFNLKSSNTATPVSLPSRSIATYLLNIKDL